jgi:hypothetical protein
MMTLELKNLININDAATTMRVSINDLLFNALEDKLKLFSIAAEDLTTHLIPCNKEWIEEERFYIDTYELSNSVWIEISKYQIIELNSAATKSLIIDKNFSSVELVRSLGCNLDDSKFDYWKTNEELFRFDKTINDKPEYDNIGLEKVYILNSAIDDTSKLSSSVTHHSASPTNTSLKVIGLLMHHLAKSPKYLSGIAPNKSQIKELLLQLAVELDMNNYGLNKVDERLLNDAMKYLETQKN